MAVATIKLLDSQFMGNFFFSANCVEEAKKLLRDGFYETVGSIGVPNLTGEAVAEDIFCLTNNPSREDERESRYGRGRSLSSGDIVNVDGEDYLCLSVGWKRL